MKSLCLPCTFHASWAKHMQLISENAIFDTSPGLGDRINEALALLYRARQYARDVGRDPWEFSVEIRWLHAVGLTDLDLLWLVHKGLVKHKHGSATAIHESSFQVNSRFVMSEAGLLKIEDGSSDQSPLVSNYENKIQTEPPVSNLKPHILQEHAGLKNETNCIVMKPQWNASRRILRVGNQIVKQFRVPATNQDRILTVFEEEGWVDRIDDPLLKTAIDPKRRLQAAIVCLNRNQADEQLWIRFRGDGTGMGVCWELTESGRQKARQTNS